MKTEKAIILSLGEVESSVISAYELGKIVYRLYREGSYRGESLNLQRTYATKSDYDRYLKSLLALGVLEENKEISGSYNILGRRKGQGARELACEVDPFCYISHLSAMEYHGLTDRMPVKLYLTTPTPLQWRAFAEERMLQDLGEVEIEHYRNNQLPELRKPKVEKINRIELQWSNASHPGAYVNRDGVRVASIGRTFLDLLRHPDLCGGMRHVMDVFAEHAEMYSMLIYDELDQHGRAIDKVRAGYLMEEVCNINHPRIQGWEQYAQRGGSRKLDPSADYHNEWSDKWMISLNVF